jgi:dTDP-4-dehydrorhamnose 3,5-epimerase
MRKVESIILPIHKDSRGTFRRLYDTDLLENYLPLPVIQVSISTNPRIGTLRGLHYQAHPAQEWKVVQCIQGEVWDLVLDLRKDSSTYGKFNFFTLNQKNNLALIIPPGYAHGFQTQTKNSIVTYFMTAKYDVKLSRRMNAKDENLKIPWPLPITEISDADLKATSWPQVF